MLCWTVHFVISYSSHKSDAATRSLVRAAMFPPRIYTLFFTKSPGEL